LPDRVDTREGARQTFGQIADRGGYVQRLARIQPQTRSAGHTKRFIAKRFRAGGALGALVDTREPGAHSARRRSYETPHTQGARDTAAGVTTKRGNSPGTSRSVEARTGRHTAQPVSQEGRSPERSGSCAHSRSRRDAYAASTSQLRSSSHTPSHSLVPLARGCSAGHERHAATRSPRRERDRIPASQPITPRHAKPFDRSELPVRFLRLLWCACRGSREDSLPTSLNSVAWPEPGEFESQTGLARHESSPSGRLA
jgi:hypothetical protein